MKNTPSIAAVVVSHDSEDDLPSCLDALLAADDVRELMVVDNRSRDRSCEVVRSYDDGRVQLLEEDVNTGFAGGCNRGYLELAADHRVLAFLNPDVAVEPSCLRRAHRARVRKANLSCPSPGISRRCVHGLPAAR